MFPAGHHGHDGRSSSSQPTIPTLKANPDTKLGEFRILEVFANFINKLPGNPSLADVRRYWIAFCANNNFNTPYLLALPDRAMALVGQAINLLAMSKSQLGGRLLVYDPRPSEPVPPQCFYVFGLGDELRLIREEELDNPVEGRNLTWRQMLTARHSAPPVVIYSLPHTQADPAQLNPFNPTQDPTFAFAAAAASAGPATAASYAAPAETPVRVRVDVEQPAMPWPASATAAAASAALAAGARLVHHTAGALTPTATPPIHLVACLATAMVVQNRLDNRPVRPGDWEVMSQLFTGLATWLHSTVQPEETPEDALNRLVGVLLALLSFGPFADPSNIPPEWRHPHTIIHRLLSPLRPEALRALEQAAISQEASYSKGLHPIIRCLHLLKLVRLRHDSTCDGLFTTKTTPSHSLLTPDSTKVMQLYYQTFKEDPHKAVTSVMLQRQQQDALAAALAKELKITMPATSSSTRGSNASSSNNHRGPSTSTSTSTTTSKSSSTSSSYRPTNTATSSERQAEASTSDPCTIHTHGVPHSRTACHFRRRVLRLPSTDAAADILAHSRTNHGSSLAPYMPLLAEKHMPSDQDGLVRLARSSNTAQVLLADTTPPSQPHAPKPKYHDSRGRSPERSNNLERRSRSPRPDDVCFYCKEPGHWANECPQRRAKSAPPASRSPSPGPREHVPTSTYHLSAQLTQPQDPHADYYPLGFAQADGHHLDVQLRSPAAVTALAAAATPVGFTPCSTQEPLSAGATSTATSAAPKAARQVAPVPTTSPHHGYLLKTPVSFTSSLRGPRSSATTKPLFPAPVSFTAMVAPRSAGSRALVSSLVSSVTTLAPGWQARGTQLATYGMDERTYMASKAANQGQHLLHMGSTEPQRTISLWHKGHLSTFRAVLVDTGSNWNVITSDMVAALGLRTSTYYVTVRTVTGVEDQVRRVTEPLTFIYGCGSERQIVSTHCCLVVDNSPPFQLLLGNQDLMAARASVDQATFELVMRPPGAGVLRLPLRAVIPSEVHLNTIVVEIRAAERIEAGPAPARGGQLSKVSGGLLILAVVAVVCIVGMLLLMAGIEPNPGPIGVATGLGVLQQRHEPLGGLLSRLPVLGGIRVIQPRTREEAEAFRAWGWEREQAMFGSVRDEAVDAWSLSSSSSDESAAPDATNTSSSAATVSGSVSAPSSSAPRAPKFCAAAPTPRRTKKLAPDQLRPPDPGPSASSLPQPLPTPPDPASLPLPSFLLASCPIPATSSSITCPSNPIFPSTSIPSTSIPSNSTSISTSTSIPFASIPSTSTSISSPSILSTATPSTSTSATPSITSVAPYPPPAHFRYCKHPSDGVSAFMWPQWYQYLCAHGSPDEPLTFPYVARGLRASVFARWERALNSMLPDCSWQPPCISRLRAAFNRCQDRPVVDCITHIMKEYVLIQRSLYAMLHPAATAPAEAPAEGDDSEGHDDSDDGSSSDGDDGGGPGPRQLHRPGPRRPRRRSPPSPAPTPAQLTERAACLAARRSRRRQAKLAAAAAKRAAAGVPEAPAAVAPKVLARLRGPCPGPSSCPGPQRPRRLVKRSAVYFHTPTHHHPVTTSLLVTDSAERPLVLSLKCWSAPRLVAAPFKPQSAPGGPLAPALAAVATVLSAARRRLSAQRKLDRAADRAISRRCYLVTEALALPSDLACVDILVFWQLYTPAPTITSSPPPLTTSPPPSPTTSPLSPPTTSPSSSPTIPTASSPLPLSPPLSPPPPPLPPLPPPPPCSPPSPARPLAATPPPPLWLRQRLSVLRPRGNVPPPGSAQRAKLSPLLSCPTTSLSGIAVPCTPPPGSPSLCSLTGLRFDYLARWELQLKWEATCMLLGLWAGQPVMDEPGITHWLDDRVAGHRRPGHRPYVQICAGGSARAVKRCWPQQTAERSKAFGYGLELAFRTALTITPADTCGRRLAWRLLASRFPAVEALRCVGVYNIVRALPPVSDGSCADTQLSGPQRCRLQLLSLMELLQAAALCHPSVAAPAVVYSFVGALLLVQGGSSLAHECSPSLLSPSSSDAGPTSCSSIPITTLLSGTGLCRPAGCAAQRPHQSQEACDQYFTSQHRQRQRPGDGCSDAWIMLRDSPSRQRPAAPPPPPATAAPAPPPPPSPPLPSLPAATPASFSSAPAAYHQVPFSGSAATPPTGISNPYHTPEPWPPGAYPSFTVSPPRPQRPPASLSPDEMERALGDMAAAGLAGTSPRSYLLAQYLELPHSGPGSGPAPVREPGTYTSSPDRARRLAMLQACGRRPVSPPATCPPPPVLAATIARVASEVMSSPLTLPAPPPISSIPASQPEPPGQGLLAPPAPLQLPAAAPPASFGGAFPVPSDMVSALQAHLSGVGYAAFSDAIMRELQDMRLQRLAVVLLPSPWPGYLPPASLPLPHAASESPFPPHLHSRPSSLEPDLSPHLRHQRDRVRRLLAGHLPHPSHRGRQPSPTCRPAEYRRHRSRSPSPDSRGSDPGVSKRLRSGNAGRGSTVRTREAQPSPPSRHRHPSRHHPLSSSMLQGAAGLEGCMLRLPPSLQHHHYYQVKPSAPATDRHQTKLEVQLQLLAGGVEPNPGPIGLPSDLADTPVGEATAWLMAHYPDQQAPIPDNTTDGYFPATSFTAPSLGQVLPASLSWSPTPLDTPAEMLIPEATINTFEAAAALPPLAIPASSASLHHTPDSSPPASPTSPHDTDSPPPALTSPSSSTDLLADNATSGSTTPDSITSVSTTPDSITSVSTTPDSITSVSTTPDSITSVSTTPEPITSASAIPDSIAPIASTTPDAPSPSSPSSSPSPSPSPSSPSSHTTAPEAEINTIAASPGASSSDLSDAAPDLSHAPSSTPQPLSDLPPPSTPAHPSTISPEPYLPPRTPLTEPYLRNEPEAIFSTHPGHTSQPLPHHTYTKHDWGFTLGHSQMFTPEQWQRFVNMIERYKAAFAMSMADLAKGYQGDHPPMKINITNPERPCKTHHRWHTPMERTIIRDKLQPLVELGIVVPSPSSNFACNLLLPPKKDADGNWTDRRLCTDYRAINTRAELIPHRPPRIEELFMRALIPASALAPRTAPTASTSASTSSPSPSPLSSSSSSPSPSPSSPSHSSPSTSPSPPSTSSSSPSPSSPSTSSSTSPLPPSLPPGTKVYTRIDMRSGFLQLWVDEAHAERTGFYYENTIMCYRRVPFGLKSSPCYYQMVMDYELQKAGLDHCCMAYIDDVLCHSESAEEHIEHVEKLLQHLIKINLLIHPEKSIFGTDVVEYLGHNVSSAFGITPHAARVAAIQALPEPTNVSELRHALGFINYYRCYIPNASAIASPLHRLLQKDVKWTWTDEHRAAFQRLKDEVSHNGRAIRPPDYSKPLILYTDFSQQGIAAVLAQPDSEGGEYMVACISRSLNKHERNYASYKGEMLAAVWAVKTLDPYLRAHPFILVTDHQPLQYLLTSTDLTGQYARWALVLQEYNVTIQHRKGKLHENVDVPSRHPRPDSDDFSGARADGPAADPPPPPSSSTPSASSPSGSTSPTPSSSSPPSTSRSPSSTAHVSATITTPSLTGRRRVQFSTSSTYLYDTASLPRVHHYHPGLPPPLRSCIRRPTDPLLIAFAPIPPSPLHPAPVQSGTHFPSPPSSLDMAISIASLQVIRHLQRQSPLSPASTLITTGADIMDISVEPAEPDGAPPPELFSHEAAAEHRHWLRQRATRWVAAARRLLRSHRPPRPLALRVLNPASSSFYASITTAVLPTTQLTSMLRRGVTLYEPFGGMCSGLEALLRLGVKVNRYLYSDVDNSAQLLARHRVQRFVGQYPDLVQSETFQNMFVLPQDVRRVHAAELRQSLASPLEQWIVIAGWECQDLSPAGSGAGLRGHRSITFYDLVRILGHLQSMLHHPPAYLLENTAIQIHPKSSISRGDFQEICAAIGLPVLLDAARVDSYATRLRNYWTNLADTTAMQLVLDLVERTPGLLVRDILEPGATAQTAGHPPPPPFYPANQFDEPMSALPTLVSARHSYAFSNGNRGMVVGLEGQLREPTVVEREAAMGYDRGATAAPGLTEHQRHAIIGRAMDGHAMQALLSVAFALNGPGVHVDPISSPIPTLSRTTSAAQASVNAIATILPPIRHSPPPPHRLPRTHPISLDHLQLRDRYPLGYSLLRRCGWRPGEGLGAARTGPLMPVGLLPTRPPSAMGLGASPATALEGYGPACRPHRRQIPHLYTTFTPARDPDSQLPKHLTITHRLQVHYSQVCYRPSSLPMVPASPAACVAALERSTPAHHLHLQHLALASITTDLDSLPALALPPQDTSEASPDSLVVLGPPVTMFPDVCVFSLDAQPRRSRRLAAKHEELPSPSPSSPSPSPSSPSPSPSSPSPSPSSSSPSLSSPSPSKSSPSPPSSSTSPSPALHTHSSPSTTSPADPRDVWNDGVFITYISTGSSPSGADDTELRRLQRRARRYTWESGKLRRVGPNGARQVIPPPATRPALIKSIHEQCGHFGAARTLHLLLLNHWWYGVADDVREHVRRCQVCSRVNQVSFNSSPPHLNPLPIEGLMYRWGCDLAGPFPISTNGFVYVMICIEHFSKWAELVPLREKTADHVAQAFLHNVLSRFGACAEVVTDQGGEFEGAFDDLLRKCFVDHRTTSPNHPQANGLSERLCQTIKRGLAKMVASLGDHSKWDELVDWVALGYRCSIQKSTGFSPYHLLFGVQPIVPPAVRERLADPLLDPVTPEQQESVFQELLRRVRVMQEHCVMAGHNLRIAQQRDTLRYARLRGGGYSPKLIKFEVGDFVYLRRPDSQLIGGLTMQARPEILRVVDTRPSGVLMLQGKCGSTIPVHMSRCAPCHLPDLDSTIDPQLAKPPASLPCEICGSPDDGPVMLLCDSCSTGWHTFCLQPPLSSVPEGNWICPRCTFNGVTEDSLPPANTRGAANAQKPEAIARFAPHMHGRYAKRDNLWGKIEYRGNQYKPRCFVVHWSDGTQSDPMTHMQLAKVLQPSTATPPNGVFLATTITSTLTPTTSTTLPAALDLSSPQAITAALSTLMPEHHWPAAHCTRLFNKLKELRSTLPCVTTKPEEVVCLLEAVDFSSCVSIADLWAGQNSIQQTFQQHSYSVITNDLNPAAATDYHLDALQPATYHHLQQKHSLDAIVISPWFALLDLALPLAVAHASCVVCCHVPGHYIFSPPEPRRHWLKSLLQQRRLHLLMGLPRSNMGMRCVWLVIASTPTVLRQLIKPEYSQPVTITL